MVPRFAFPVPRARYLVSTFPCADFFFLFSFTRYRDRTISFSFRSREGGWWEMIGTRHVASSHAMDEVRVEWKNRACPYTVIRDNVCTLQRGETKCRENIYIVVMVKLNHTSPRTMGFPRNDRKENHEIAGSSLFPPFYSQSTTYNLNCPAWANLSKFTTVN